MSAVAIDSTPSTGPIDIFDEIDELRRSRNAVILAHYYQDPDIQDLADHIGDSLQLAKAARATASPPRSLPRRGRRAMRAATSSASSPSSPWRESA